MINIKDCKKIHCIGIGGTGVSGLARLLHEQGKIISGSDLSDSALLGELSLEGIKVFIGQSGKNIEEDIEVVIYSSAVTSANPEMQEALKRRIPALSYPQAIGQITSIYKTICVCGTHGKTTLTSMAAAAFIKCQSDPTVIVGAKTEELKGKNERLGRGEYMILESCEYKRAFLNYHPQIIIINNIEADHLDYYKNIDDYRSAYGEFIQKLHENGIIIANGDDPNVQFVLKNWTRRAQKLITFGRSQNCDYVLNNNEITHHGAPLATLNLSVPGAHNLMNACAALALCNELEMAIEGCTEALNAFHGAYRRSQIKGKFRSALVIDDYGHHPTEISTTLQAVRQRYGDDKKIICVFQPHQYSRTKLLLEEFGKAFVSANQVLVPNILAVRDTEEDIKSISTDILVEKIKSNGISAINGESFDQTIEMLKKTEFKADIIVTMGAGDIYKIADQLVQST